MVDIIGYDEKEKQKAFMLGKAVREATHHPGYSEHLSALGNATKGHELHKNWAHVFKELNALANLTHKPVFKEAASIAHQKAIRQGDYKNYCQTCKKSHVKDMAMATA